MFEEGLLNGNLGRDEMIRRFLQEGVWCWPHECQVAHQMPTQPSKVTGHPVFTWVLFTETDLRMLCEVFCWFECCGLVKQQVCY